MNKEVDLTQAQAEIDRVMRLIAPHQGKSSFSSHDNVGNALSLLHSVRRYIDTAVREGRKEVAKKVHKKVSAGSPVN